MQYVASQQRNVCSHIMFWFAAGLLALIWQRKSCILKSTKQLPIKSDQLNFKQLDSLLTADDLLDG